MKRTTAAGCLLCIIWLLSTVCVLLGGCSTAHPQSMTSIRQLEEKWLGADEEVKNIDVGNMTPPTASCAMPTTSLCIL